MKLKQLSEEESKKYMGEMAPATETGALYGIDNKVAINTDEINKITLSKENITDHPECLETLEPGYMIPDENGKWKFKSTANPYTPGKTLKRVVGRASKKVAQPK